MAVWPIYWLFTLALIVAGAFSGRWKEPAIVLFALILTRATVNYTFDPELWVGMIWLIAAISIAVGGAYFAAILFVASGLCYPLLRLVGFRIEHFGFMPFLADLFFILGLLCVANGTLGPLLSVSPDSDRSRISGRG